MGQFFKIRKIWYPKDPTRTRKDIRMPKARWDAGSNRSRVSFVIFSTFSLMNTYLPIHPRLLPFTSRTRALIYGFSTFFFTILPRLHWFFWCLCLVMIDSQRNLWFWACNLEKLNFLWRIRVFGWIEAKRHDSLPIHV